MFLSSHLSAVLQLQRTAEPAVEMTSHVPSSKDSIRLFLAVHAMRRGQLTPQINSYMVRETTVVHELHLPPPRVIVQAALTVDKSIASDESSTISPVSHETPTLLEGVKCPFVHSAVLCRPAPRVLLSSTGTTNAKSHQYTANKLLTRYCDNEAVFIHKFSTMWDSDSHTSISLCNLVISSVEDFFNPSKPMALVSFVSLGGLDLFCRALCSLGDSWLGSELKKHNLEKFSNNVNSVSGLRNVYLSLYSMTSLVSTQNDSFSSCINISETKNLRKYYSTLFNSYPPQRHTAQSHSLFGSSSTIKNGIMILSTLIRVLTEAVVCASSVMAWYLFHWNRGALMRFLITLSSNFHPFFHACSCGSKSCKNNVDPPLKTSYGMLVSSVTSSLREGALILVEHILSIVGPVLGIDHIVPVTACSSSSTIDNNKKSSCQYSFSEIETLINGAVNGITVLSRELRKEVRASAKHTVNPRNLGMNVDDDDDDDAALDAILCLQSPLHTDHYITFLRLQLLEHEHALAMVCRVLSLSLVAGVMSQDDVIVDRGKKSAMITFTTNGLEEELVDSEVDDTAETHNNNSFTRAVSYRSTRRLEPFPQCLSRLRALETTVCDNVGALLRLIPGQANEQPFIACLLRLIRKREVSSAIRIYRGNRTVTLIGDTPENGDRRTPSEMIASNDDDDDDDQWYDVLGEMEGLSNFTTIRQFQNATSDYALQQIIQGEINFNEGSILVIPDNRANNNNIIRNNNNSNSNAAVGNTTQTLEQIARGITNEMPESNELDSIDFNWFDIVPGGGIGVSSSGSSCSTGWQGKWRYANDIVLRGPTWWCSASAPRSPFAVNPSLTADPCSDMLWLALTTDSTILRHRQQQFVALLQNFEGMQYAQRIETVIARAFPTASNRTSTQSNQPLFNQLSKRKIQQDRQNLSNCQSEIYFVLNSLLLTTVPSHFAVSHSALKREKLIHTFNTMFPHVFFTEKASNAIFYQSPAIPARTGDEDESEKNCGIGFPASPQSDQLSDNSKMFQQITLKQGNKKGNNNKYNNSIIRGKQDYTKKNEEATINVSNEVTVVSATVADAKDEITGVFPYIIRGMEKCDNAPVIAYGSIAKEEGSDVEVDSEQEDEGHRHDPETLRKLELLRVAQEYWNGQDRDEMSKLLEDEASSAVHQDCNDNDLTQYSNCRHLRHFYELALQMSNRILAAVEDPCVETACFHSIESILRLSTFYAENKTREPFFGLQNKIASILLNHMLEDRVWNARQDRSKVPTLDDSSPLQVIATSIYPSRRLDGCMAMLGELLKYHPQNISIFNDFLSRSIDRLPVPKDVGRYARQKNDTAITLLRRRLLTHACDHNLFLRMITLSMMRGVSFPDNYVRKPYNQADLDEFLSTRHDNNMTTRLQNKYPALLQRLEFFQDCGPNFSRYNQPCRVALDVAALRIMESNNVLLSRLHFVRQVSRQFVTMLAVFRHRIAKESKKENNSNDCTGGIISSNISSNKVFAMLPYLISDYFSWLAIFSPSAFEDNALNNSTPQNSASFNSNDKQIAMPIIAFSGFVEEHITCPKPFADCSEEEAIRILLDGEGYKEVTDGDKNDRSSYTHHIRRYARYFHETQCDDNNRSLLPPLVKKYLFQHSKMPLTCKVDDARHEIIPSHRPVFPVLFVEDYEFLQQSPISCRRVKQYPEDTVCSHISITSFRFPPQLPCGPPRELFTGSSRSFPSCLHTPEDMAEIISRSLAHSTAHAPAGSHLVDFNKHVAALLHDPAMLVYFILTSSSTIMPDEMESIDKLCLLTSSLCVFMYAKHRVENGYKIDDMTDIPEDCDGIERILIRLSRIEGAMERLYESYIITSHESSEMLQRDESADGKYSFTSRSEDRLILTQALSATPFLEALRGNALTSTTTITEPSSKISLYELMEYGVPLSNDVTTGLSEVMRLSGIDTRFTPSSNRRQPHKVFLVIMFRMYSVWVSHYCAAQRYQETLFVCSLVPFAEWKCVILDLLRRIPYMITAIDESE